MPTIEVCPACGDKFPYSRDKERCKKCDLPIGVARENDPAAIIAWKQQTLENKRLFGRMHARQERLSAASPMAGDPLPSKRQRKLRARAAGRGRSTERRWYRNKHGRVGVKQSAAR